MPLKRRQFLLLASLSAAGFIGLGTTRKFLTASESSNLKISQNKGDNMPSIPNGKPIFRFVAIGDAGTGEKGQYEVAKAMVSYHQNHPFQVVTLLGDNIYTNGEIEKINAVFEKPYQPLLEKGVKFYACLGNHDLRTENGNRQVTYPLFNMQGRYYTFKYDPVQFFVLDANDNADWEKQIPWLEDQLKRSQTPWKIIYSHFPIYSSGLYGVNPQLINRLTPLFKKYGVQVYMNGHEHNYERTKPIDGTTYLISGNGGASIRRVGSSEWTATAASTLGFTAIEVYADQMLIQAIDTNNQVFDQGIISL
ncbi:MAG TPA: metallophosphoesterase [Oscillatoriales bacterium UBA8482]|nr:MAG: metallophosphoesterase [Oscillatoriales cyanobacterium CG2_30_40_61]HBW57282.1 metallophosphoesterase [Oscillatoriales bacterium UBA8482]